MSARGFSGATLPGRGPGRPASTFEPSRAASARIAAQRWQSFARSRAWGSDKPRTSTAERNADAARAGLIRAERRFQGEDRINRQADVRPVSWQR